MKSTSDKEVLFECDHCTYKSKCVILKAYQKYNRELDCPCLNCFEAVLCNCKPDNYRGNCRIRYEFMIPAQVVMLKPALDRIKNVKPIKSMKDYNNEL